MPDAPTEDAEAEPAPWPDRSARDGIDSPSISIGEGCMKIAVGSITTLVAIALVAIAAQDAYATAASDPGYQNARAQFASSYAHGMQRSAALNLFMPNYRPPPLRAFS